MFSLRQWGVVMGRRGSMFVFPPSPPINDSDMLNNNDLILSDEVEEGNQDQDSLEEIPDNQGEEMQEAVEPEMEKE